MISAAEVERIQILAIPDGTPDGTTGEPHAEAVHRGGPMLAVGFLPEILLGDVWSRAAHASSRSWRVLII